MITLAADPSPSSLRAILRESQSRLFGAADSVCLERARLVTEAWRQHAGDPVPIKRAKALAHVMANMTLDLDTNPIFAGCMSSGPRRWMLVPEHGFGTCRQVEIEHDDLRGFVDDKVPADLRDYWAPRSGDGGLGHLAIDQDLVVHRGLRSVLEEIGDRDDDYRAAMRIAVEAVIAWAHRFADEAEERASMANDAALAACHRRVAAACRHVPEHAPRDLFEALQAMLLVHMAIHVEGHTISVSIGLPDRALARFAEEAAADPDRAADLCAAFALKLAENAITGKGSKTQCVTVGGVDHLGRDCCNAITEAFLAGFDRVAVSDPHLFLRWHRNVSDAVKERAITMIAGGRSMPLLVNDEPTAGGFIDAGVAPADAWDYCVIGCNELGIPGRLFDSATPVGTGSFNDIALLNTLLRTDKDVDGIGSMAELLQRLEGAYVRHFTDRPDRLTVKHRIAATFPTPFTTAMMTSGVDRGSDLMVAMPYDIPCSYQRGLANAVNALAAIEQIVFIDGAMRLSELVEAAKRNLEDRRVRERIGAAPRWCNDDDRADRWATALVDLRERALNRVFGAAGTRPVVCHVVRSLHHADGARIDASLDGRLAGRPVGDSIGGLCGTMRSGPTAALASVLKLDARRSFAGGTNLNLTLPSGQADPPILHALVEGFFGDGGQELQIAVLSAARLREARQHPERYGDLVVRIAGLNARFVELSAAEQDELIARAEAAEAGA